MKSKWICSLVALFMMITTAILFVACNGPRSSESKFNHLSSLYDEQNVGFDRRYQDGSNESRATGKQKFMMGRASGAAFPSKSTASAGQDELWIIQKPTADQSRTTAIPDDQTPTSGTLAIEKDQKFIPVPLKHTDVKATISGYISSVLVTQQFENNFPEKIEAVYVFPLPDNAGINEFVMTVGDRKIRGIIREREEATKIYNAAKTQGYVASLMTQERPNIFTQRVANIEPGKKIDIQIRYFHTLSYQDGWYEWAFPMVVGPRYNPEGTTDGIGAISRGRHGTSGQSSEVPYLKPTDRSGHDISLAVDLHAGVTIEKLNSVNHKIQQQEQAAGRTSIKLDQADSIPNKDFVLRYKVAGKTVKSAMFVQKDAKGNGGFFTLMLVPPEELKSLPRRSVEMVFVVDTSGSMSGEPLAQCKNAVAVALGKMDATDTFQIVQFAGSASQMAASPLSASAENRRKAETYVHDLNEGGGTEMLLGINKALDFHHDENRTRVVAFLTDGFIGNETEILRSLYAKLSASRVFSFGVGSSPNRYLLNSMAQIGNGTAAYLSLNDQAEPIMNAYFERISHPALTNIALQFDGLKVTDVYPKKVPDLFVGKPVIITGRFQGTSSGTAQICGQAGKEQRSFSLTMGDDNTDQNPGIRTIWARMKIADLTDTAIRTDTDITKDVKAPALEYGLMSPFTAFVAVDSLTKTAGDHGTTIAVPVPMPDGVKYETTVKE